MKNVEIYTDGACRGNPGPGGRGVVLRHEDSEKTLREVRGKPPTTVWS